MAAVGAHHLGDDVRQRLPSCVMLSGYGCPRAWLATGHTWVRLDAASVNRTKTECLDICLDSAVAGSHTFCQVLEMLGGE